METDDSWNGLAGSDHHATGVRASRASACAHVEGIALQVSGGVSSLLASPTVEPLTHRNLLPHHRAHQRNFGLVDDWPLQRQHCTVRGAEWQRGC